MSTIVDSTGVQIELDEVELPATIKHPRRIGREHPVKHCYKLSHATIPVGHVWGFHRVGGPALCWRGVSERTAHVLGTFKTREAAIGAVVIDALRRDERFSRLTIEARAKLLLPSPKQQRDAAFHRLVADLGGGAEARFIAEMMRANREAVNRWCLAMVQVDERVAHEAAERGNWKTRKAE